MYNFAAFFFLLFSFIFNVHACRHIRYAWIYLCCVLYGIEMSLYVGRDGNKKQNTFTKIVELLHWFLYLCLCVSIILFFSRMFLVHLSIWHIKLALVQHLGLFSPWVSMSIVWNCYAFFFFFRLFNSFYRQTKGYYYDEALISRGSDNFLFFKFYII